jgi:four helix bundle protein
MARKITDLQCWRLADQLRVEVNAICEQPSVAERRRFCDGFTEAAGSVCRNTSEGFGRFDSAPIVQFFTYALASLQEVEDYLRECLVRKFIDKSRLDKDLDLLEHTRATTLKFMRPHQQKRRRRRRRD